MEVVLLAQSSQDHKLTVNAVLIFVLEMNSFMNGDIASHVHKVKYMTEAEDNVKVVQKQTSSQLTSSQLSAVNVNTDQWMVLNASLAQIILVPKTGIQGVLEINVKTTKFKMLMELALTAQRVQDQTSFKEIVLKLSIIQAALIDKSMLKL